MQELTDAILQNSRACGRDRDRLVGVMAFFLGLMKVAQDAGLAACPLPRDHGARDAPSVSRRSRPSTPR